LGHGSEKFDKIREEKNTETMTTHANPLYETVTALQERRDPTAYVRACLDRIDDVDPEVRAFLPETDRRTRVTGAVTERIDRYPDPGDRPPLFGIPVGVKDIFHVDGFETRAGSDLPSEVLVGPQSEAVTTLINAGAVILGKTVTTEFAYFDPGPTRNPHNTDHTPGGSSSGSAGAVAAGMTPLALGSQTIGSIIRPASFCGIVGVKPTYDRIPIDGVLPLSRSADHVGYFTQDVEGARHAASVLYDEWTDVDATNRPILGVPDDAYLSQASADALAHFETRLEELRETGYEIRETDALADIETINARHQDLVAAEAALSHTEWYADYDNRYADSSVELVEDGHEVAVGRLVDARNGQRRLRAVLEETMTEMGIDAWVAPAAPGPAPSGINNTGDPVMNLPWTHASVPTISLPAGRIDGLPMGLQFASGFDMDERLLAWSDDLRVAVEP
jgi:Asp-tRNA(Asn)/Glu-tRNA(Gln) amidotransferase A subunit family amidase